MIVKILQRLPAFVVAIVPPFGRPSHTPIQRDDHTGVGLMVVQRTIARGTQHPIAQGYTNITDHRDIQTHASVVAVFDIERAVGGEQLRDDNRMSDVRSERE